MRSPSPRTARPAHSSDARRRRTTGSTMPILDYEHPGPDELRAEYDAARPPFSESLSPRLPCRLNLGAQFFWQERRFPEGVRGGDRLRELSAILGLAAVGRGCDGDVLAWGRIPTCGTRAALRWSSMVEKLGWKKKLAPLRPAFDRLGPIRPALAKRLGLAATTRHPVRHPRFQRFAAPASEGADAAVRGRLDRHLGHPLRGRRRHRQARPEARHARQCQRARRSGALRALHGRARVRAADRWRRDEAERGGARARARREGHGARCASLCARLVVLVALRDGRDRVLSLRHNVGIDDRQADRWCSRRSPDLSRGWRPRALRATKSCSTLALASALATSAVEAA